jgi:hypothetical protein
MKFAPLIAILSFAALLAGCAAPIQQPVPMYPTALKTQGTKVGVAMSTLPKVDTNFPGASCLLCLAAASMANSSLTKHSQTLPSSDLNRVRGELANILRKKGHEVVMIPESVKLDNLPKLDAVPNKARQDFSSLRKQYGIDKLVVIEIAELGFTRSYSAYIPTSDPKAVVSGKAYLVNLADNSYEWYQPVRVEKSANGAWDEAPAYPGLSNAYFQAIEGAYDILTQPFAN